MNIVEITRMASRRARDHLIRRNVSSRRINSKIAIASFFSPSLLPRNRHVLFATIQLLRSYRQHKLHAPFIWSSKADKSDLSRALYAFPADRAGCTFEMIYCAAKLTWSKRYLRIARLFYPRDSTYIYIFFLFQIFCT